MVYEYTCLADVLYNYSNFINNSILTYPQTNMVWVLEDLPVLFILIYESYSSLMCFIRNQHTAQE